MLKQPWENGSSYPFNSFLEMQTGALNTQTEWWRALWHCLCSTLHQSDRLSLHLGLSTIIKENTEGWVNWYTQWKHQWTTFAFPNRQIRDNVNWTLGNRTNTKGKKFPKTNDRKNKQTNKQTQSNVWGTTSKCKHWCHLHKAFVRQITPVRNLRPYVWMMEQKFLKT